jgi:hypothetical protein
MVSEITVIKDTLPVMWIITPEPDVRLKLIVVKAYVSKISDREQTMTKVRKHGVKP